MESYINCKKKLYNSILEFLDESDEINQQNFAQISEDMKNINVEGDQEEMMHFLLIIKSICDHHHRDGNLIQRSKEILQHYQEQINKTLLNDEIFHIFESNKLIVLFLLQRGIINITDHIYNDMIKKIDPNGNKYCHFFYPELEKFKGEEKMKSIKEELLSINPTVFEGFEDKRREGENDSYICSLIRKDSIDEFIVYINRHTISVNSEIKPSIFETNSFLIENKSTSLIEYSAFFGSIQIFQYLLMNDAELTPSLWLYSIHSNNAELIHLLESNRIEPPIFMNNYFIRSKGNEEIKNESYLGCLIESIKCHQKNFSEYIENNLMQEQEIESTQVKEEIISNSIKYYNYSYFQTDEIKERGFFHLLFYNYDNLFGLLLKEKEEEIKKRIIYSKKFFYEKMISAIKIQ